MPKIHTTKAANYENDAYIVTQMRNAMHHILYTVVNSNAMNGWASTDTLKTITPWWQTAIYALNRSAGRPDHPVRMAAEQGPQG